MPIVTKPETATDVRGALIGYNNLLTASTTSAAEKALIGNTWERYRPSSGALTVKFQMGSAANVDFIGIAAHNFKDETLLISTAATIGGALTDVESISPVDNKAIMIEFDTRNIQEIAITGTLIADSELGIIYAGEALRMPRNIYGGHSPIVLSDKTDYQSTTSETGQFLGRTITSEGGGSSFEWSLLDPYWMRNTFDLFIQSAKRYPFFIKWRPDLFSDEAAFGFSTGDIKPSNSGGGLDKMSVSFSMNSHEDV